MAPFDMVLSRKIREFDDDDIVRYGVDAPLVGVRKGRETRELRDMALTLGAILNLPKPTKAAPVAETAPEPQPVVEAAPADTGVAPA